MIQRNKKNKKNYIKNIGDNPSHFEKKIPAVLRMCCDNIEQQKKKGELGQCLIYRGISLLNTIHKIVYMLFVDFKRVFNNSKALAVQALFRLYRKPNSN